MTGAKLKNQAPLQALPLRIFPAEHNSANKSVVDCVTSCVKMFSSQRSSQVGIHIHVNTLAVALAITVPTTPISPWP